jgi:hypothetical protein
LSIKQPHHRISCSTHISQVHHIGQEVTHAGNVL